MKAVLVSILLGLSSATAFGSGSNIRVILDDTGPTLRAFGGVHNRMLQQNQQNVTELKKLIKDSYKARSDAELFEKILVERDRTLNTSRPPDLIKIKSIGEQKGVKVSLGIGDFSISNEGLVLEISFKMNGCVVGVGQVPTYYVTLLIKEESLEVWQSSTEKITFDPDLYCSGFRNGYG